MKLDMDKESVEVVAVGAITAITCVALVVGGDTGQAVATGMLSLITGVVGYLFGARSGSDEDAEKV